MEIPGGWFPSDIFIPAFYSWDCVQVSHQELGTCGTCAWSAAQPSAFFLILAWWISLFMGLSQNGASVMLTLFVLCFTLSNSWVILPFLCYCEVALMWPVSAVYEGLPVLFADNPVDICCLMWDFKLTATSPQSTGGELGFLGLRCSDCLSWKNSELFWSSTKFYLWH